MSKPMSTERKERVAEILVEAFAGGNDVAICGKWGISNRTLRNYRKRLETDEELAKIFRSKKARCVDGWEAEVPGAMRESISFIRRAAEVGDPRDPDMLHAVAGALKMVSGVASSWKFLEAKLDKLDASGAKKPPELRAVSGGKG